MSGEEDEDGLWSQHAIMLRRTSLGLNNSLIFVHYFMFFVGDLLFIVSCVLPQWIILKQRRNQLPFDASMCFISISHIVSVVARCWFSLWWCSELAHVLRHQYEVLNITTRRTGTRFEMFATGYNKWYRLHFVRCRMGCGEGRNNKQWIMTIITSNAIDVAHQTYVST